MSLATICLPIQSELGGVEAELVKGTSSQVELVSAAAQYVLQNGGKRIRPALLLLAAKMLGADVRKAVSLGAAIEMIHAASLMHDDVLDNATLRRSKPSTNVKWGNQISILVGDFLWCRASEIAISYGDGKILSAITEAVKKTTEGEILEIVKGNDFGLLEEEYLEIVRLKTAMLFACSCQLGVIFAGGTTKFEELLRQFGLNLGIAFQLSDDVLDYIASPERFGKKVGRDLCEGKITLPVIYAMKRATPMERGIIKETLLANALDERRLNAIQEIFKRYETLDATIAMAAAFVRKAGETLASFKPSLEKDALLAIANYSISRSE